jgi:hypothetical protein
LRSKSLSPRIEITNVRVTAEERFELESSARRNGFPSISESMLSVLKQHYPAVAPALEGVENAFHPWKEVKAAGTAQGRGS